MTSVALGTLDGRPVIVSGYVRDSDDSYKGAVRVWDLTKNRALHSELLRGHDGAVSSVALGTLDGRPVIVSGGDDNTVRVWSAQGQVLATIHIRSAVHGVTFMEPGNVVVAASQGLLLLKF